MLSHVLRLRDQGWRGLLPILPPGAEPARWLNEEKAEEIRKAAGKGPGRFVGGGRWAGLGDWRNHPDDEDTLATWGTWPGVNIGLRACYANSGVVFLDADVTDPGAAGEVGAEIRRTIGRASDNPGGLDALVRFGRAPKALFPIRVRGSLRKLRSAIVLIDGQRCMLEVLAQGQQAVIGGIHPGTGQPYAWPLGGLEDIGPEDLPELTASEIGELVDRVSAILLRYGPAVGRDRSRLIGEESQGPRSLEELRARNPELALDAARFIHNSDWSRDDWVAWGYALRGAFGDEGEKLWLDFTAQSDKHHSAATARKVWADATRAEEEDRLGSGAGTILRIARDEGWAPPIHVIDGPAPHFQAEEIGAEEAGARLREVVAKAVRQALDWTGKEPAPQTGIKAAAGLGKSMAVLEELARTSSLPQELDFDAREQPEVWFFVPTSDLARELAAKARALGLAAQVVRGREAKVDDEPLCRKHEVAGEIARAGLPVMTSLCRILGEGGAVQTCPFFDGCRYLKQFKATGPTIRFFAHDYLPLVAHLPKMPPSFGLPPPNLVVIDESFALRMARHASPGIDRLTSPRVGMKVERLAEIMDVALKVRDLLEKGLDPRTAADPETFRRIAGIEAFPGGEAAIWPAMRWEEQKQRAGLLRKSDCFKLATLWRTLAEEAERSGPLQRVELRRNEPAGEGEVQDRVHIWWRGKLRLPDVPVILLDGSLDEQIARKFSPRIEVETIAARRKAEVIQVSNTACSRNRLLSFEGAAASEQARAANRLRDVRHLAEVEAKRGRTLLVTYLAAEEQILGSLPGVDVAHFGALRGLDRYKDHDTIIVAGREQPSPKGRWSKKGRFYSGLEDNARSLFGDDGEPLNLSGSLTTELRGYRLRDGTRRGVEVAVHADPRCQAIMEQIRERETEQAIDRLRLIHRHRDRPARVILLSNMVVDCTVDRLVSWRELMPDRLTVAAARLEGVLPLAPAWLAARYPDLWASAEAAKHETKGIGSKGETPNKVFYFGSRPLKGAAYRLSGRRGGKPARALIVADHPAPETALAALVGPQASFRWDATTEAEAEEPAAAAGPEAAPPEEPVSPPVSKLQASDHEPEAAPAPPPAGCARCGVPVDGGTLCQVCAWLGRPPVRSPPRPLIAPSWEDDRAWLRLIGKAESREKRIEVVAAWAAAAGGTLWRRGDEATLALPATLRRGLARAELLTQTRILLFDRVQIEEYQPGHIPFAPPVTRPLIGLRRVGLPWARRS